MTRRYVVASGRSECGMHIGSLPCRHCAMAAWLTDAALERVVPQPPKGAPGSHANTRRLTAAEVQRIRDMAADGKSRWSIYRATGVSESAVKRVLSSETYRDAPGDSTPAGSSRARTQSPRQRAAHQAWTFGEHPAARAERQAMPPLRSEGRSAR